MTPPQRGPHRTNEPRRCRRELLGWSAGAIAGSLLGACTRPVAPDLGAAVLSRKTRGPTDVTFLVAADTHLGRAGMDELNQTQIAAMNSIEGKPWPARSLGTVARPRGVIVAGDLTESGSAAEWQQFTERYGSTGLDGLLRYPVFLCTGNHDRSLWHGHHVLDRVRERHGSLLYGWAWQGVRVLCLDLYPTQGAQRWLRRQLARLGDRVPVVLFFHYPLSGMLSGFWRPEDKEGFALAIARANVVAIFHGHAHDSRRYRWKGHDVYNVGSPKHGWHSFAAVRITDRSLLVASWDWGRDGWGWWHRKSLARAVGQLWSHPLGTESSPVDPRAAHDSL